MPSINSDPIPPPVSTDPTDPLSPYYDPTILNPIKPTAADIDKKADAKDDDVKAVGSHKSHVRRLRILEQQLPNYTTVNPVDVKTDAVKRKGS